MQRLIVLVLVVTMAGAALGTSDRAWAHQQQEALTTILFNQRSGNIDVMHRFYIHDAEHVVSKIDAKKNADIIANGESQKAFGQYVAKHFALQVLLPEGKNLALDLRYVGQEVEGKFLWVYQQIAIPSVLVVDKNTALKPELFPQLAMRHSSLQEFWPEQRNVVNIEFMQQVKTLIFRKDDEWQSAFLL
ncbi:hypothetical protein TDB9533_01740 [Thalassocella blandensis]|nr:hypothetical protein TDB9533_01740 [Thalassocella blandensis]